jgi:hypothetical protein
MKDGRCATMTDDYERNGTTTLFAALNVLDATVLGRCMQRHRHQEFIRFLNMVEAAVPAGELVHAILDNYATHRPGSPRAGPRGGKHPKVMAWLARHPRWTFHFTPTSASPAGPPARPAARSDRPEGRWLNAVEGFFAKLTRRRVRRGVFGSLVELQAAIHRFLAETNAAPKPFVWSANPDHIIEKVSRGKQALDAIH